MPQNIKKSLEHISNSDIVIGFMRHAARDPIRQGEIGNEVPLTNEGIKKVIQLKELFRGRIVKLYSSPVLRCMETANLLSSIAKYPVVTRCNKLGAPGIFVENSELATPIFLQYQDHPVDLALALLKEIKFPGFCLSISKAIEELIAYFSTIIVEQGISLCITHDSILGILIGIFFQEQPLHELWPDYLETLFVGLENGSLTVVYRGKKKILSKNVNRSNQAY